tara:strand:+ start:10125 stop:10328 length:204 start_codon:yes stop_codon:yes gene_type:complete
MAKIQLNGKKITFNKNMTISNVLIKYKLDNKKVAIELNGEILPKNKYNKKKLQDNDKIEIVHFIGGG